MLAWEVRRPGIQAVVRARPEPAAGELLLRVRACAVCRTDLHVAEGFREGERVGVAWPRHTWPATG